MTKRTETKFQMIASEIKANAAWRKLLAGDWSDEQEALQAIAKKFGGEYTATGGGIYVTIIPLGEHDCMGVSAECCCKYYSEKAARAYDIFCEHYNDPREGIVSMCDATDPSEGEEYAAWLCRRRCEGRDWGREVRGRWEWSGRD